MMTDSWLGFWFPGSLPALVLVMNGIGHGRREIISPRFRRPRVGGRKLPVSGTELRGGCTRPVDRPTLGLMARVLPFAEGATL
jgi:hypothetical protein